MRWEQMRTQLMVFLAINHVQILLVLLMRGCCGALPPELEEARRHGK
jgi:hypothetical protein